MYTSYRSQNNNNFYGKHKFVPYEYIYVMSQFSIFVNNRVMNLLEWHKAQKRVIQLCLGVVSSDRGVFS